MPDDVATRITDLTGLNQISEALNRAVDVRSALEFALARLLEVMALETGWIFLKDESNQDRWAGRGYSLAAHLNLPPSLSLDQKEPWDGGCDCQGFCNIGKLTEAYNEVRCTRLADSTGDRRNLAIHASAPLKAGDRTLGILNVAAPSWDSFMPEALALLSNVGSQMGVALERARLYDLLRDRRIHEQEALLELSQQLLRRLDLEEVIEYLVRESPRLLAADAACVVLQQESSGALELAAAHGFHMDREETADLFGLDPAGPFSAAVVHQKLQIFESIPESILSDAHQRWVEEEEFVSMALIPLVAEDRSLGAFVLFFRQPWRGDPQDRRFLRLMANQSAVAIEKARLHRQELDQQRLEDELSFSRQIQQRMLPAAVPAVPGWEFAAVYMPARQVGGDYYDFIPLTGPEGPVVPGAAADDAEWGIVIADVADKGLPAAMFMALSSTMIRAAALSEPSPAEALLRAHRLIMRDSRASLFLSVVYARLDVRDGRLTFANAGHNRPLWARADAGQVEELQAPGVVLGAFEDIQLTQNQIQIGRGDHLVFYTDGVTEAMDGQRQMFGLNRLIRTVQGQMAGAAEAMLDEIIRSVATHTASAPQSDDVTVVVLRRTTDDR